MKARKHPSLDIVSSHGVELSGKKIILCVAGSVAAYKSIELARLLMRHGADVTCVVSDAAAKLVKPDYFRWATGNDVITKLTGKLEHIQVADYGKSDLIIVLGYDFAEYAPSHWNPKGQKRVIHIDYTPSEVDDHYPVAVELVGDIGETLSSLSELAKDSKDAEFSYILRDYILGELEEALRYDGFPVKPQRIIAELREVMRRDDIIISDVGAHKIWLARMYPTYEPNTLLISNGFSAMGIALPGAIAAKLLYPEKKVVAVCGDGGFMMTCQELETACRLNLPIVVLIFNDNGYGLIKWKQLEKFGREYGVSFGNPNFVQLANSFGAKGYKVKAASELKYVLTEALEQRVPAVIDVPVDYSENMRLTERLGRLICVV